MNSQYRQTVECTQAKSQRINQFLSLGLELFALGLIFVAIFVNYYIFFAAAIVLAIGIFIGQKHYSSAKEYEYSINHERLVICKTNVANRKKRVLDITLISIKSYGDFIDIIEPTDMIFTDDPQKIGIKCLVFENDGKKSRLLFEPDNYLNALLEELLKD